MSPRAFLLRSAAAVMLAAPHAAMSQPLARQIAVSGDVGLLIPREQQLSAGVTVDAALEVYPTSRIAIRSLLGLSRSGADGSPETLSLVRVGTDVIYNWEGGRIHPFAGGGLGLQVLRLYFGEDPEFEQPQLATNVLGGVEVFVDAAWAVKVEGRYVSIKGRSFRPASALGAMIGLKRYF